MSAPESIVLPRSGVRLTIEPHLLYWGFLPGAGAWLSIETLCGGWHRAHAGRKPFESESMDACVAWLDAEVLSLRASLLAGTEERIARAIGDAVGDDGATVTHAEIARAVLSALTGGTDDPA